MSELSDRGDGALEQALLELRRLASLSDDAHIAYDLGTAPSAFPGVEDRFAAAEARFQALVEQIPAVTFSASFASGLKELYVSPQIEDVMGYTQEEWLDSPVLWYERLHPDDKARWNREFGRTIALGTDFKAVYRFLSKDGRVVWLHGEARIVRDAAQRPLWLQGVGFDVTDVYEAQARVRDVEARAKQQLEQLVGERTRELAAYRHLVNSSTDAIASLRRDGTIDNWNARATQLFGLDEAQRGRTWFSALFARDQSAAATLQRAIAAGESCSVATVWASPNGSPADLSISIAPVRDENQVLLGMSAIVRDESEYRRAARRFELAVEAAPNAMIMVDSAGKVTLVNSDAERLFGYTRQELVGQPIEIIVPEAVRAQHPHLRAVFNALPRQRAMGQGRDLRARRKDGSEFPVEIGLNPIETAEGLLVLCAVVDISERKRTEQALFAANAALRAKTAEIEEFVYTVSHDLKSPLVTMGAFLDIHKEDLARGNQAGAEDAMRRVRNAVTRMHDLISDLLELSRVGSVTPKPTVIHLNELLEVVIEASGKVLTAAGIEVTCEPGLPTLRADRNHLYQALENLLSNAAKYASSGKPPRVVVSSEQRGSELLIKVSDNGPGIPAEQRERVFKLFHRLQARNTRGTGVGLAIVARVMQSHGGRAWVEPAATGGACFVLALPLSARVA
ncbi:MAG TPA: PAS domain S-box protein [Polyangiales bacterium]|nr:PAS domain S-box protein [Polyangiales bacterium]